MKSRTKRVAAQSKADLYRFMEKELSKELAPVFACLNAINVDMPDQAAFLAGFIYGQRRRVKELEEMLVTRTVLK